MSTSFGQHLLKTKIFWAGLRFELRFLLLGSDSSNEIQVGCCEANKASFHIVDKSAQ